MIISAGIEMIMTTRTSPEYPAGPKPLLSGQHSRTELITIRIFLIAPVRRSHPAPGETRLGDPRPLAHPATAGPDVGTAAASLRRGSRHHPVNHVNGAHGQRLAGTRAGGERVPA